ncbi:bifunctional DNA primase/polymerase [Fructobacillus sp. CRL 2054]|uniref:bifunctional DNA primase/polymerase n=1 Tax=Fructobacillus sp. CRL 2054 TaxID=2763007 RepID=UPI00237851B5|nr:bifunctional DNA primase/polymerase [Fructobacillus sp. CRL 2054]MDD9139158.1 bifunctional DNA primase/polymerase [Fructobacillus sp. CRL 2054]
MKKIEAINVLNKGYRITPVVDKKPILPFATVECDKKWVLRNWKPNYDIAIVCGGDDWFAVDFDNKDVYEKLAPLVVGGHIEQSKRGYHAYFKQPDEPLTQKIGLVHDVDIKASKNNYVVIHSELPELDDLPDAGDELLAFIENTEPEHKQTMSSDGEINFLHQPLFDVIKNGWGEVGTHDDTIKDYIWLLLMTGVSPETVLHMVLLADAMTPTSTYKKEELAKKVDYAWQKWSS